jgi:hypothetical protein
MSKIVCTGSSGRPGLPSFSSKDLLNNSVDCIEQHSLQFPGNWTISFEKQPLEAIEKTANNRFVNNYKLNG